MVPNLTSCIDSRRCCFLHIVTFFPIVARFFILLVCLGDGKNHEIPGGSHVASGQTRGFHGLFLDPCHDRHGFQCLISQITGREVIQNESLRSCSFGKVSRYQRCGMPVKDGLSIDGMGIRLSVIIVWQKSVGRLVHNHIGVLCQVVEAPSTVGVSTNDDFSTRSGWFDGFLLCDNSSIWKGKRTTLWKILDNSQCFHWMTESCLLECWNITLANRLDEFVPQSTRSIGLLDDVANTGNTVGHGRCIYLDSTAGFTSDWIGFAVVSTTLVLDFPYRSTIARKLVVVNGINITTTLDFSVEFRWFNHRDALVTEGQPIRGLPAPPARIIHGLFSYVIGCTPVEFLIAAVGAHVILVSCFVIGSLVEIIFFPFRAVTPFRCHCHIL
mmetsp:Transcript_5746/g.11840  ORF Transcript_5746/g.11840 Transcript_5746/m.11840 type:complete len:384 (-) Transcript_5746:530-1681(-)